MAKRRQHFTYRRKERPVNQNVEKSFTVTLKQSQLGVIGAALQELPYKVSAPVLASLDQQLAEQVRREQAELAEAAKAAEAANALGAMPKDGCDKNCANHRVDAPLRAVPEVVPADVEAS